jgi:hypothetical protein
MHPVLSSCRVFLNVLRDLIAGVRAGIGVERPEVASKAVAARVAAGLRLVEAYLRRVLIVMALEIEPSLVDAPKPMRLRRSNGRRKAARPAGFKVLDRGRIALPEDVLLGFKQDRAGPHTSASPSRTPVPMGSLYRRLDLLAALAADPLGRARRLAFHLARTRPGPMLAPDLSIRPPLGWCPQASTSFSAMGHEIIARSRVRPPPLPPPRRYGPSIIMLGADTVS